MESPKKQTNKETNKERKKNDTPHPDPNTRKTPPHLPKNQRPNKHIWYHLQARQHSRPTYFRSYTADDVFDVGIAFTSIESAYGPFGSC